MKFGMEDVPLGNNPKIMLLNFLPSVITMADEKTCEVGSKVVPLAIGSYNDV
jgi:hypothetical protein